MPRRYRRRRYAIARPVKTVKYSNETFSAKWELSNQPMSGMSDVSAAFPLVKATNVLATRKAKNFTLRMVAESCQAHSGESDPVSGQITCAWALVFVPEGTDPSTFSPSASGTTATVYEPNQNVIMSGFANTTDGCITFKTRLARNLNSGDQIYLILRDVTNFPAALDVVDQYRVNFMLNYAISY